MKPSPSFSDKDERDLSDGEGLVRASVLLVTFVLGSGMAQGFQVLPNGFFQFRGFLELRFQRCGEAKQQLLAFFLEGVGDVFEEDETKASMCPRILSAAAQSWASKSRAEPLDGF
jgi:hypothetical protein